MLPKIKQKKSNPSKQVKFQETSAHPIKTDLPKSVSHDKSKSLNNLSTFFNKSRLLSNALSKQPPISDLFRTQDRKPSQKEILSQTIRSYIDRNFKYPSSSIIPNKILYPGDWKYDSKQVIGRSLDFDLPIETKESIFSLNYLNKLADPEVFLPEEDHEIFYWREVESIGIESREGATIVKHSGGLVLFGGLNRQKHNEVNQFSMVNLEWRTIQTQYTPKERSGHTAVSYKHKVVVYGGYGDYSLRFAQRRCDKKVSILSMKNLKWQVFEGKGHVPRGRRNHATCRLGKFMLVFGGIDKMSRSLSSCFVFNLKSHVWEVLPEGPFEVSHCTFTTVYPSSILDLYNYDIWTVPHPNSSLAKRGFYVVGGLLTNGMANSEIWVLNLSNTPNWSRLETSGTMPTPRYAHTTEMLQKYLIIFGGRNDNFYSSSGELVRDIGILDLSSLVWQSIPYEGEVPKPRWGHCSCVYENKLIIFGGIDYKQFMQSSIFYMNIEKRS